MVSICHHTGVCLVSNKERLLATVQKSLNAKGKLYIGEVSYSEYDSPMYNGSANNMFHVDYSFWVPNNVPNNIENLINENYQDYYFRKHADWKSESEFRILLRGQDEEPDFISISNSLDTIILGVDFTNESEYIVHQRCKELSIQYGIMCWRNGTPDLQIHKPL